MPTLNQLFERGILVEIRPDTWVPDPDWLITALDRRGVKLPIVSISIEPRHDNEVIKFSRCDQTSLLQCYSYFPNGHNYSTLSLYRRQFIRFT